MRIVGLMRVKNEARWIGEAIASMHAVCEDVYVMDDHSTDDTPWIARNCGAFVYPSPFDDFNEARDKEWLLRRVVDANCRPIDYFLMIDGDEVLEVGAAAALRAGILSAAAAYSLPVVYLWNNRNTYRSDGVYSTIAAYGRPSLFRLEGQSFNFAIGNAAGNLHCSNVPEAMLGRGQILSGARLLHLGYMHREDRERKYWWYSTERDPKNEREDGYRHVVIGDIFPAESRFKLAGPLELRSM